MWRLRSLKLARRVAWALAVPEQGTAATLPKLAPAFGTKNFAAKASFSPSQGYGGVDTLNTTDRLNAYPQGFSVAQHGGEEEQEEQEQQVPDLSKPSGDPIETLRDYHRFTDIYLGGLWNRLESELRQYEGDQFEYDVQLTSGCMRLKLPDDAEVVICKDAQEQALKVESNLHDVYGGGAAVDVAAFKLNDDGEFADGGMALHQYLEDHLAKHLKVQLDLEPQPGPHEKVYGPDPT